MDRYIEGYNETELQDYETVSLMIREGLLNL
jgi:hypothetical protein